MIDIGMPSPDFAMADGETFHGWRDGRWTLLVAAKALSPTCSTEFAEIARLMPAFSERRIAISAMLGDPAEEVDQWLGDLLRVEGLSPSWPITIDKDLSIGEAYGILDRTGKGLQRAAIVIAPDGTVATLTIYSVTNGRSFTELLRIIEACQLTASARVATAADWQPGAPVMLPPSLSPEDAELRYPQGVDVRTRYLRFVTLAE